MYFRFIAASLSFPIQMFLQELQSICRKKDKKRKKDNQHFCACCAS